jgi:cobalamin biosynthesis protein CobD/CbiB
MVAALAYLPFRIVWAPTVWVGRVVAWLAEGYRTATTIERVLIFPSWAVLRGVFIVGWMLANMLHTAARRTVER